MHFLFFCLDKIRQDKKRLDKARQDKIDAPRQDHTETVSYQQSVSDLFFTNRKRDYIKFALFYRIFLVILLSYEIGYMLVYTQHTAGTKGGTKGAPKKHKG